jgi:hypothetical protein
MKNGRYEKVNHPVSGRRRGFSVQRLSMTVALSVLGALGMAAAAHAQSTAGRVFGSAPAGQTVTVRSTSGVHRHATANDKGRYTIGSLPMGNYEVALEKDGKSTDKRSNIKLTVGGGAEIDFACEHDQCAKPENH